jgi:hypothetical protein
MKLQKSSHHVRDLNQASYSEMQIVCHCVFLRTGNRLVGSEKKNGTSLPFYALLHGPFGSANMVYSFFRKMHYQKLQTDKGQVLGEAGSCTSKISTNLPVCPLEVFQKISHQHTFSPHKQLL